LQEHEDRLASETFLSSLHSEFFSNLPGLRIDAFACFTDFFTLQRFSPKDEAQPDTLFRMEPWLTPLRQAQTNDWNANLKDRKNCLDGLSYIWLIELSDDTAGCYVHWPHFIPQH
jgi:hypothetical protein